LTNRSTLCVCFIDKARWFIIAVTIAVGLLMIVFVASAAKVYNLFKDVEQFDD
jgi:hypothetical protein